MVLNIPTREFKENPKYSDLIGADDIFATLKYMLSYKHESALIPIELTHDMSSISDYAASHILQLYIEKSCSR
jgi:hypothetical protein